MSTSVSNARRSALAGALLALSTAVSTATAEVSHRFVEIPVVSPTVIDVDENGVDDYHRTPWEWWSSMSLVAMNPMNDFLLPLSGIGDEVGPEPSVGWYYPTLVFANSSPEVQFQLDPGDYFVGLEFFRDGAAHYGWLGFKVLPAPSDPLVGISVVISEIGWESEPGAPIVVGWGDCNGNGLNDVVELLSGADLPDCNGDFVHDDCQPDADCNGNGIRDLCELGTPGVLDCNGNLFADSCEIVADPSLDCDGDGAIDVCMEGLVDCDGNGISDQCQSIPPYEDCNGNGLFDWCEILSGADLPDCNGDLVHDDCQPDADCDGNGVRDLCELWALGGSDCNWNLIPDSCDIAADPSLDCDGDDELDACPGGLVDCNGDGVHDQCQSIPPSEDCNGNGLFDLCEMNGDPTLDCDADGVFDACAIAAGLVDDCNGDGIPDVCQQGAFPGDASFLFLPGNGAAATVPSFCTVIPTSEITIELWQWIKAPGPAATLWTHLGNFNRCLLHAPFTDGKVYWDFGQAVLPNGRLSYTPPEPITGSWQHFALQASNAGEFMRIYRNGVLEAEKTGAESFTPELNSLKLGGTAWGSFNGRIDELRVWDHVRTSSQIQQSMDVTVDPATPGLVGYWRFDEGSGSLSQDLAGTHDALLNGLGQWGLPPSCPPSPDLNGDGIVDGGDLGILLGAWGTAPSGGVADLNVDGVVDGADVGVLLSHWG